MTNELQPIPTTAAGWPYLSDNHPVHDTAAYSQKLAASLAGFVPSGGAPVRNYASLYNSSALNLTETSGWVRIALPDVAGPRVGFTIPTSPASSVGRLVCTTAGHYAVLGKVHLSGATGGDIEIRKNGVFVPGTTALLSRAANSATDVAGTTFGLVSCAVGDYIELFRNAFQAVTLQAARGQLMAFQIG